MNWMFLPFRRFAEFTGRSRPMELWMFALLQLLIYIAITVLLVFAAGAAGVLSASTNAGSAGLVGLFAALGLFALLYPLVYLVFFIPNLAVSTRRLHDSGKSGFWVLLYFVPALLGWFLRVAGLGSGSSAVVGLGLTLSGLALLGLIALIVLWCLPGTVGPNRYGPDPLAGERRAMGGMEGYGAPGPVGLDKSY